jgi:DNA recombination protein RmuC
VQAPDHAERDQRVPTHAGALRYHDDSLAARRYPTAFRPAAPFTVLFVPSDGFLTTALEAEPGLLEYGFTRDVVLATPSTLLALLRTVAYSWRQERLARDADQVLAVGRLLHARLSTMSGHLTRLGAALGTTMTRFNETVGSYERSVLTAARRFDDLGIAEKPVPEPGVLVATVRTLRPAEPLLDAAADEDEPSRDGTTG